MVTSGEWGGMRLCVWLSGDRLGSLWIGRGACSHQLYAFHVPGFTPGTFNVISFNPHKNLVKYCSSHLQIRSQKLGDLKLPAQHHTVSTRAQTWGGPTHDSQCVPPCWVPGGKAAVGASSWESCHLSSVKGSALLGHGLYLWLSHVLP